MKRHNFDPTSFVIGVLITGIGIVFAAGVDGVGWIIPATIGGVGVVLLTAATQRVLKERTLEA